MATKDKAKMEEIDKEQLWQSVLGELEVSISPANFKTWFSNTFISRIEDDGKTIVVGVKNVFTQNWLSQKYHRAILESLQNMTNGKVERVAYTIETKPSFQERALESVGVSGLSEKSGEEKKVIFAKAEIENSKHSKERDRCVFRKGKIMYRNFGNVTLVICSFLTLPRGHPSPQEMYQRGSYHFEQAFFL